MKSRLRTLVLFGLCQATGVMLWAQVTSTGPDAPSEDRQTAPAANAEESRLAFHVSGFLSFRTVYDDDLALRLSHREYSGSIFVSKKIGQWLFHSEINANSSPEFDSEGIRLLAYSPNLHIKLDNATLNYNRRDWFQVEGGFMFVPTYWRTHRYQSTTLTVDEPLLDQNVFPTAFTGAMIHGDTYVEKGGISYQVYGGVSKQEEFQHDTGSVIVQQGRVIGAKLVVHVPSRNLFDTFDVGYHRMYRIGADNGRDQLFGWELDLEKGPIALLGEFAHASNHGASGALEYFQQGYYLQTSYRLTQRLFAVARYDWLNRDSRFANESGLAKQSVGLTCRPRPDISLKIEMDRIESQRGRIPAYYGPAVAIVYSFHIS